MLKEDGLWTFPFDKTLTLLPLLNSSQLEPESQTRSSAEPQHPGGILTLILTVAYLSQMYDLLQATDTNRKNKQTNKQPLRVPSYFDFFLLRSSPGQFFLTDSLCLRRRLNSRGLYLQLSLPLPLSLPPRPPFLKWSGREGVTIDN